MRTKAVALAVILAAGTVLAAPSAPKAQADKTVVLEYKMPAGRTLTYQGKSEEAQIMEVQGQAIDTQAGGASTFTFKAKGPKDKNFLVGVTVDDLSVTLMSSAQGDMSPNTDSVKGKSFDMVLSPLGAEVDVSGAEALVYSVGDETRNLFSGFKVFFPDLPGKPVKVGDTWPSTEWTEEKTDSLSIRIDLRNANTLEGFETIDGMECARVATEVTGSLNGTGSQMGMDLIFAGTSKGKTIWHFAVKEGLFVKMTSETTSELSIDVAAAGVTIPMTETSKGEVKLTAKS